MKFIHYELCFSDDERIKMNKHTEKHEKKEKNETKSP